MLIWDGKFTKPITREYKISLCTTCMGRLHDLRHTLPANIELNKDYPNIEFVILDYNSDDGLADWVKKNMMMHIESGLVAYFRTTEPKYYSMSHSRNVAFKVATGDIVNNVDADNFTTCVDKPPALSFARYLNMLANEQPRKAIFAKGKRLHGRLGFFKDEFIECLGGYDEGLMGYGHDDEDLRHRAWKLGFRSMRHSGQYIWRIHTPRKIVDKRMEFKGWRRTEKENKRISQSNINMGLFKANLDKNWGKANLIKNFAKYIEMK